MTTDDFDPLDDLLCRRPVGQVDETVREAGLAQTLPVLRRRRLVRRAGWGLAFAGCYLAGVASSGVWPGGVWLRDEEHHPVAQQPTGKASESTVPKQPKRGSTPGTRLVGEPESPARPQTPFEQLRGAGDDALQRRGDIESAVRLYAQALEVATPAEKQISAADDNWLLMALKQDQVQENEHVDQQQPGDEPTTDTDRS